MRRTWVGAVMATGCLLGAPGAIARSGVPARLRDAVRGFAAHAQTLEQSQVIPSAQATDRAAQAAVVPCEQDALGRGALADAIRLQGRGLRGDVRAAGRGESGLYAQARSLGPRHAALRRAITADLDLVGHDLDQQLADAGDVAAAADAIDAGDCAAGAGAVSAAAERLEFARGAVDAALSRLVGAV